MTPEDQATIAALVRLLPPHAASCSIEHNPHKDSYQSVSQFLERFPVDDDDCGGAAARKVLEDGDELWVIHWYPNTPVGFYHVFSATLEGALSLAHAIVRGQS